MKACLYTALTAGGAQTFVSIDRDTDCLFWLDADYREGVRRAMGHAGAGQWGGEGCGTGDGIAGPTAEGLLMWPEPLPLGLALEAAGLWGAAGGGRARGIADAADALARCVGRALAGAGEVAADCADAGAGKGGAGRARIGGEEGAPGGARVSAERRGGEGARRPVWVTGSGVSGLRCAPEPAAEAAACAERIAAALKGRALLLPEAQALFAAAGEGRSGEASWTAPLQLASLLGLVRLASGVAAELRPRLLRRPHRQCRCLRCGSGEERLRRSPCAACGRQACAYCEACLTMGRSRECELLALGAPETGARAAGSRPFPLPAPQLRLARWGLSPAQREASLAALRYVESELPNQPPPLKSKREMLIWAVTGAGKTEMLFPLLESVCGRGGKALIATPRRDVVLELDPRIRKAFPELSVVTLYGGSGQRWEKGDITIATTHQLLRFQQAFRLVVIDELDAYPFHGDPILHYAADRAAAPGGTTVLLSATPPKDMQRRAGRGKLAHVRVPVRYHRHPLPVPQLLRAPAVKDMLRRKRIPPALRRELQRSLGRGAQIFVFVPFIKYAEPMAGLLGTLFPGISIESTSSGDAGRKDKVDFFRRGEIRMLVTTTILERGVTIPRSDVVVLDADAPLFDEASLVQMAGRAGRSADDPAGRVVFCSRSRNRPQIAAVRHIRTMNRLAGRNGYLLRRKL